MNCFKCDRPANGVCKFCGRAICRDHYKEENFILDLHFKDDEDKALVVEKALKCEFCRPRGDLIDLKLK